MKEGGKIGTLHLSHVHVEGLETLVSNEERIARTLSSLAERVMRTVNMRINVGKWSPSGAFNAMNLRLAY